MYDSKIKPVTTPLDETLNQPEFFSSIIGELAGLLESMIGLRDAEGFISTVGGNLGHRISGLYPVGPDSAAPDRLAEVLVDLKTRIKGEFEVVSADADQIVLSAGRCPFGDKVKDRPSLCMMTTNVFGRVVADRTGYAHVTIDKAIAQGDAGCRVVVALKLSDAAPTTGVEFFAE